MDRHSIIEYLRAERDILTKALEALEGAFTSLRGRPSGKVRRKHRLASEGRRRLSQMMKKRWAERRKSGAGSAVSTKKAGKGQLRRRANKLTPEGRRRLSKMMKKRWAERKKAA